MKNEIRKELLEKRKIMSKKEVLDKSKQIKKKLFDLDEFKNADTILFYVSYGNEVFTHEMIKECLKNNRNIVIPITIEEKKELVLSKLENWKDLVKGAYNILEPKEEKRNIVSIFEIDLVIVPGVGFDIHGCRIGHGEGYYDGLLKDSTNALHIGLSYENQIIDEVPIEGHDIPVDKVITEDRIINCNEVI